MRLPRNLRGTELVALLNRRYGYTLIRQRGSHMRLVSNYRGHEHHISVPRHNPLKTGTLNYILGLVADYLEVDRAAVARELFGG